MTITISEFQAQVYFVIKNHGPIGPSQIGNRLNYEYESASASVTRPLRFLVKRGLIKKVAVNKRVVKYEVTHDIDPVFEVRTTLPEYERILHENL